MASQTSELISSRVRAILAEQRISVEAFAAGTGLAQRTCARRLSGRSAWTTDELDSATAFLGISLPALTDPRDIASLSLAGAPHADR